MTAKKTVQQPAEVESTETTEATTAPAVEPVTEEGDLRDEVKALRLRVEALEKELTARRSVRRASGSPSLVPQVNLDEVPKLNPDASEVVTVRESRGGMRTSKGWTGQTTSRHLDRFLVKNGDGERIGYVILAEDKTWRVEGYDKVFPSRLEAFRVLVSSLTGEAILAIG
ncbi:hypothetical protein [Nocardiopsis sp. HUAS JQ3]|uniref:hypothetical protein n=1 Tax=Nocardiopsis sp. HUAS JQ3 TaxID=3061629 RepID=UPI0023A9E94B|nr:hypothetical protein [Nocardiopsis sp. HUAS JQ3]WDZ91203.1 hypothetical protein PV789_01080 [Nocardiopsis sp. HUAS JQ3]